MKPFAYARPGDAAGAVATVAADPDAAFLAGGTNLVDHLKLGIASPTTLVDVTRLTSAEITDRPSYRWRCVMMHGWYWPYETWIPFTKWMGQLKFNMLGVGYPLLIEWKFSSTGAARSYDDTNYHNKNTCSVDHKSHLLNNSSERFNTHELDP